MSITALYQILRSSPPQGYATSTFDATHAQANHAGDTAFHKAAVTGPPVAYLERLLETGVDVNQPNSAGRLPLHVLCSVGYWDPDTPDSVGEMIKWIIRRTKNVNACDHKGVNPLHLASTLSEQLVKQLLAAGADPAGPTLEGLTPLHLAARARESNIVGILLEALETSDHRNVSVQRRCHLNARDQVGRTPLHYASRSGRHETVSLLLAAGADPALEDDQGRTTLEACTEFEEEQALWAGWRKPDRYESQELWKLVMPRGWDEYAAGGLTLEDPLRPWVGPGRILTKHLESGFGSYWTQAFRIESPQETTRIEEIIDNNEGPPSFPSDEGVMESLQRRVSEAADREKKYYTRPGSPIGFDVFEHLLLKREYHVIQWLFRQGGPSLPILTEAAIPEFARLLAQHGFAHLLETMLDSEYYGPMILDACSHAHHDPRYGYGWVSADPILLVAARRELPNMDVLRLLVEKKDAVSGKGMNLNAKGRTGQVFFHHEIDYPGRFSDSDEPIAPGKNTALHEFAKGRHWWHVAQGLPYLLAAGADAAQRSEAKQTPLEMAEAMLLPYGGEETYTIPTNSSFSLPREPNPADSERI
ncbi:ankyrin repeat-containing protein [Apiospora marii]|uniref:ankyrin repeat-containing protein n=1 Tax=Apiospora marii TaxID=335849 RepID=UPI00313293FA